jgi:hypothetical protein
LCLSFHKIYLLRIYAFVGLAFRDGICSFENGHTISE